MAWLNHVRPGYAFASSAAVCRQLSNRGVIRKLAYDLFRHLAPASQLQTSRFRGVSITATTRVGSGSAPSSSVASRFSTPSTQFALVCLATCGWNRRETGLSAAELTIKFSQKRRVQHDRLCSNFGTCSACGGRITGSRPRALPISSSA